MDLQNKSQIAWRLFRFYSERALGKCRGTPPRTDGFEMERVSPDGLFPASHPYCEPENLRRIPDSASDQWGDRSFAAIQRELNRRDTRHAECCIHHFRDVLVLRSWMYCGAVRSNFRWDLTPSFSMPNDAKRLDVGVMANTYFASRYWGHWLSQELPLQRLLRTKGPFIGYLPRVAYRDEPYWRSLVDLPEIEKAEAFFVDHFMMPIGGNTSLAIIGQQREIRQLIKSKLPEKGKCVFLMRGESGQQQRRLVNEQELAERLARQGFVCLSVGDMGAADWTNELVGASMVIGVEGSHLGPAMYTMSSEGLMVVLQPPNRVTRNWTDSLLYLGIPSAMYVCLQQGSTDEFRVDVDPFIAFVDRARLWADKTRPRIRETASMLTG